MLPLYLYNHSILSISTTPFTGRAAHASWDSGQVGFVYVTYKEIAREYSLPTVKLGDHDDYRSFITPEIMKRASDLLCAEVDEYDHFLQGECYEFVVWEGGEVVDSCGGFIGDLHASPGVLESMKACAGEAYAHLFDKLLQPRVAHREPAVAHATR